MLVTETGLFPLLHVQVKSHQQHHVRRMQQQQHPILFAMVLHGTESEDTESVGVVCTMLCCSVKVEYHLQHLILQHLE